MRKRSEKIGEFFAYKSRILHEYTSKLLFLNRGDRANASGDKTEKNRVK
jgi:hypothetical protein